MIYRLYIGPLFKALSASPSGCRYFPSCSHYTEESIYRFGIFQGVIFGIKRIAKCHPWATHELWDPVPELSSKAVLTK